MIRIWSKKIVDLRSLFWSKLIIFCGKNLCPHLLKTTPLRINYYKMLISELIECHFFQKPRPSLAIYAKLHINMQSYFSIFCSKKCSKTARVSIGKLILPIETLSVLEHFILKILEWGEVWWGYRSMISR